MDLLFTSASIKRFIYLLLVVCCAFFVWHQQAYPQSYWLIWSALMFSLLTSGATFFQRITIIFITGVVAALLALIIGSLSTWLYPLAISLFIVIAAGVLIARRWPNYYLAVGLVTLFAILSGGFAPAIGENWQRMGYILAGLGIALLFQLIFLPFYLRNNIRMTLFLSLRHMRSFSREVFSCMSQLEYVDNIYLFERRLHVQKMKCINAMMQLVHLLSFESAKERDHCFAMLAKLERLYEGILDYSQLRRRVSDYNTFAVCKDELAAISQEIENVFTQLMRAANNKSHQLVLTHLKSKINRMEENYHNVIQIAAREPLVFLLFIASLNSFTGEVELFYQSLSGIQQVYKK